MTPKHTDSMGRGRDFSSRREMLEETRNFHKGFDDPRPSSCHDQPGNTKQTPETTEAALGLKRSWREPSSPRAGLCRELTGPHIRDMPDTVPSPSRVSSCFSHSSRPGRELVHMEQMREVRQGTEDGSQVTFKLRSGSTVPATDGRLSW